MNKSYLFIMILVVIAVAFAQNLKFTVDAKGCIGCTICVAKCPVKAIEMKKNKAIIDPTKCIGCGLCAPACPVKAISQEKPVEKKPVAMPDSTKKVQIDSLKKEINPKTSTPEKKVEKKTEKDESLVLPSIKNEIEIQQQPAKIVYNINSKTCIGCKICIDKCPVNAISYKNNIAIIDVSKCIGCGLCVPYCPVKAIKKG